MKVPSTVFKIGLSASAVGLFAYLYLLKNREYEVCITYSALSAKLNVSHTILVKLIKNLERKGLLSIVKRYFRYKNSFSHRNCYRLIAPLNDDPYLPVREVISLPLSLDEKGLLLYLLYIAGEEGNTFMTKNEILSNFKPKPYKAFKSLCDKGYIKISRTGVIVQNFLKDNK